MMIEDFNGMEYRIIHDGKLLLLIKRISDNTYRAINETVDITAEMIPIDEYRTQTRCIEYKIKGKDGRFRKSKKLMEHHINWLLYMLEKKGFMEKKKTTH